MRRTGSDTDVPEFDPEVFDRAIVAVALTAGPEHRLMYYNDAFRGLFGPRKLGATAAEVYDEPDAARFVHMLDEVYHNHTPRQVNTPRTTEGTRPGAPGRRHFVFSCSPVRSRHGHGVLAVCVDTTAQVEAAQRAEELSEERRVTLQRYEALMSAVPQIIWLMKPDWQIVELVGGFEEFTGMPWRSRIDTEWLAAVHPHDRSRLLRTWKEASQDTPTIFVCTFRMRTASGEYRHVQSRAAPVVRGGETVEWVGSSTDVEDQWRNRLRERLLARVATGTVAGDLPQALAAVADAVVPELTDACAVFMLPSPELTGGGTPLTAIRVASTAREGLPPLPPMSGKSRPVGPVAQQMIENRRPRLMVFPSGQPPAGALPDVTAQWMREARTTSLTLVPILVDAAVVAFACAAGCLDSPPPGPSDLTLLGEVLHEAREPLRQAMELQRTRQTALTLQRALLTPTPRVPGAEVAARYQPASRTAEIGGDWYDALLLPDGSATLTIGDIAGHDLEAATSMSQLRSMLRVIAYDRFRNATPAECLSQLDRVADGLAIAPLVTAVHAHLVPKADGGWHAAWSNAGHPPPLLLPAAGPPRYLEGSGPDLPLCVDPSRTRTNRHYDLTMGDTLLLYTDGLIEVPGTDLADGMADLALHAEAAKDAGVSLATLCARLLAAVPERRDDAAVIGFRPIALARPLS
ncbi:PAS domain S-box-containing protein [Streptomyces sp. DvalAA-14]|uniref:SpoIIE family protein phosphatase n=1 Tax=unclassified Streptomyces TaxID=2593676 RepID=UPI00081BAF36|nr:MULTISPECIES: SpoIIE family protein phosphatase [unclassified Streptomyces]MYS23945.1 SpoIIE family protein phosphatase [Streptomyces sp. SID4948]SCE40842.1 PAS domain S-box-containing protein [Streptomyces sp. DvalAA-14]